MWSIAACLGLANADAARAQSPVETLPQTTLPPAQSDAFVAQQPHPWWDEAVKRPLRAESNPIGLDLESAVMGVLMFSPQVRIAADMPVVRQTQIVDAASRFDPRVFFDSKFTDTSDPVGNLLTTGGANRFIDQTATSAAGVRKTFTTGGQLEAAQKIGYQDNNSNFFIPTNQGTSRITLNYTQPLLNGGGQMYNTSTICLAELNTQAATANLQKDLQAIILETHRIYWDLHLRRAVLLQRIRLKQQAIDIQRELEARADFDVLQSQLVRANAAVATRDAAVIRFGTEIANSETRLRALVNDPQLNAGQNELIPVMTPYRETVVPNLADALTTALQNRPEIQAAFAEVKAAGVRAGVTKNELLPELNWVLGTYVSGLQGDFDLGKSWINQFDTGRPTYWTGLQFEYPLGNRGPNARMTQRLVELRQVTNRLQQILIQTRAETETAVREVVTTHREMLSRYHAMHADRLEVEYLTSRWRLLSSDQQLAGVVLNDLLSAQERLAAAEYDFAAAEAAYNVSLVSLNVVMGVLLQTQRVEFSETMFDGVPMIDVSAQPQPAAVTAPAMSSPASSSPVPSSPTPAPSTQQYYLQSTPQPSVSPIPTPVPPTPPVPQISQRPAAMPRRPATLLPPVLGNAEYVAQRNPSVLVLPDSPPASQPETGGFQPLPQPADEPGPSAARP